MPKDVTHYTDDEHVTTHSKVACQAPTWSRASHNLDVANCQPCLRAFDEATAGRAAALILELHGKTTEAILATARASTIVDQLISTADKYDEELACGDGHDGLWELNLALHHLRNADRIVRARRGGQYYPSEG